VSSSAAEPVLALLLPDALARHAALPILELLVDEGFEPVGHRLLAPTALELDAIFRVNVDAPWETYRYRSLDLLFRLGPGLALLLAGGGGSALERLRELRGGDDPTAAPPGSIHRRFGSVNAILSLLHVAASPADDAQARAIVFDRPPEPDSVSTFAFCRLLAAGRPERRGFEDVLAGYRIRLAAALWELLRPAGRDLVGAWTAEGRAAFARPGAGAALAEHLDGSCERPLRECLAAEFEPGALTISPDRAWRSLEGFGISLDPWERLVLTTSAYFPPVRSAAAEPAAAASDGGP
jgi:nucleoside diphosphate kinase